MYETSKSIKRRFNIGAFHNRYFVGHGIDIGGGEDSLERYVEIFPRLERVYHWDIDQGDGQYLNGISDEFFDFVYSSHSLEHMEDPYLAFTHWIRVTKAGGYLINTVPDEDLYEMGQWPSRNPAHKWSFTIHKPKSWSSQSINVLSFLSHFSEQVEVEKIELIRDLYLDSLRRVEFDQTLGPVAECSIEFILKKRRI